MSARRLSTALIYALKPQFERNAAIAGRPERFIAAGPLYRELGRLLEAKEDTWS